MLRAPADDLWSIWKDEARNGLQCLCPDSWYTDLTTGRIASSRRSQVGIVFGCINCLALWASWLLCPSLPTKSTLHWQCKLDAYTWTVERNFCAYRQQRKQFILLGIHSQHNESFWLNCSRTHSVQSVTDLHEAALLEWGVTLHVQKHKTMAPTVFQQALLIIIVSDTNIAPSTEPSNLLRAAIHKKMWRPCTFSSGRTSTSGTDDWVYSANH